jgi:polysaccharide pyruvyl transferase WcaK-like protein
LTAVRFLGEVDVVMVPGTGILEEFCSRPWGMPLELFQWSVACWLTRTKLFFVSVGAGPIHNPVSRVLMKRATDLAYYCSFRDDRSRTYMAQLGRKTTNDPVFPDIVFGSAQPAFEHRDASAEPTTIGLGVMSYRGTDWQGDKGAEIYRVYLQKLVQFCAWLLDSGYNIRVIIGDTADREMALDLRRALQAHAKQPLTDERLNIPRIESIVEVMQEIARTDIVVATRFHTLVSAAMVPRPPISLGYLPKNDELMRSLGLERYSQNVETFDVELLKVELVDALSKRDQIRSQLSASRDSLDRAVSAQFINILHLAGVPDVTNSLNGETNGTSSELRTSPVESRAVR